MRSRESPIVSCSIHSGLNPNKCLGISAGSRNSGTQAITWDCLGKSHSDQYWLLQPSGSGLYEMVNYNSYLFSLGLGPISEVDVNCHYDGPIQICTDADLLGLTSQLSDYSAIAVWP